MRASVDSAPGPELGSPRWGKSRSASWSVQSLLMALVLAVLAPMVALLLYSALDSYRQAQRQAAQSTLALARVAADSVGAFLTQTQQMMGALATRPAIQSMNAERCDPLFSDFKDLYPQFSNFSQVNLQGEVICSSMQTAGNLQAVVQETPWFRKVMAEQQFSVSAPYTGIVTGRVVSVLAHPVRDGAGSMIGSIQLPLDLLQFQPVVGGDRLAKTTVITIAAQDGTIVARSRDPQRFVGKKPASPIVAEVVVRHSGTSLSETSEGVQRVFGFVPIPGTDWYAIAGIEANAVFSDARQDALRDALVGLVVLVFATGLALALRRRITTPIRALRDTAQRVGQGHTEARADTAGPAEVAAVAVQFNAMLDARAAHTLALANREADFRMLFDSSLEGILRCDDAGRIAAANPAAVCLFGKQALGTGLAENLATPPGDCTRRWVDLVAPHEPRLAPLLADTESQGHARGELRMLRGDGSAFECAVSLSSFKATDGRTGSTLFLRDQSERELAQVMRASKESAELANRAKSAFLARMSHELRTPLNAVLGFAQLLQTEPVVEQSARLQNMVGHVRDAGTHLLSLIDEVLDLSRIEAGAVALSPEPLDLDRLVRECLALTASMAERRKITVTVAAASDTGSHWIRADRTRVRQVVVNLLSNAIKYNRDAGSVAIELLTVDGVDQAAAADAAARVQMVISDTGWGLDPEQLSSLFQPFNRLGAERGPVEGTGLGLVIVQQLLQIMGAEITVTSVPGAGSRFILHFKAVAPPEAPLHAAGPDVSGTAVAEGRGTRGKVLCIEDHLPNVELVRAVLALRPNVELMTAADGESGLATALRERPALILLDVNLPGMDGYEVLRRLRLDPATAAIPCVALTANATAGEAQRALAAGFAAHIVKPFRVAELLEAVDQKLGAA